MAEWVETEYKVKVQLGEMLIQFESFDNWTSRAQQLFRNSGHTAQTALCIDSEGHICTRGGHFKMAAYPVKVYAIDQMPFEPCGAIAGRQKILR